MNDVVFRGTKNGLVILLGEELSFERLLEVLRERLAATGHFFQGAEVTVHLGSRQLRTEEGDRLAAVLSQYNLALRQLSPGAVEEAPVAAAVRSAGRGREDPLVVRRTLRSGQVVQHRGDVIILGDVNPGAEVSAQGHIIVVGALRGVAHAGAGGDDTSVVVASRLQPTQLRIGGYVGRAPDNDEAGSGPEVARVQDGRIIIESRAGP